MSPRRPNLRRSACWIALACLVVPMFASYFFDDMFSSISYLFEHPSLTALGWDENMYGKYTSGYSVLCIFGGLALFGMLLDKWGVRVAGTLYMGMMVAGAGLVTWALLSGQAKSATVAYAGCMVFGLGSEMAGTVVNRSIGRWFKDGGMALAMGLHLAIARLGTAFALVISPKLVVQQANHVYSLSETARPALLGMGLMAVGLILWALFVTLDARRFPKRGGLENKADDFHFADALKVLGNRNFWLLGLLCVLFYSSIVAFKKFAGAILIPRFGVPAEAAGWMVSMLPFSTVVFAPLFGLMVDKAGKGTRWMILGSILALAAHLMLAFAPSGVPFWGYLSMGFLGFGYSLVPAALWPSVTKIVPDKILGTTFALIYWVQNLGLLVFKRLAGSILGSASGTPVTVELMFTGLCVAAVGIALLFAWTSRRHPELGLDRPAK